MKVKDTFAATIAPDVLQALDALGPPAGERARGTYEMEIEVEGEGTFTLTAQDGVVSAKKGFAKGDPLLSAKLGKGSWPLVRDELQAAVDGFPKNAELKKRHDALKAMKRADVEAVVKGIQKLKPLAVHVDVKGAGKMDLARGALDEATRAMTLSLDAAGIRAILDGASPDALKATVGGDRGIATEIAAVLGPVLVRLR